ncbi:MAG: MAE_28990/MAE_18760 family HEPN-like nuclease [Dehalococcoidia bacterium]|nr:MAE_28990/MAE_18760 family HEPN-like nuclease [Dehalococcoidia bacterium]MDD5495285.1 MAE_28990/MAE_18760 family HEPN-like nuclease [Dehalococcoidia bacterium]
MKIRSLSELNEFLNNELSWRKKELTAIALVLNSLRDHEQRALLRAAICLLYAHWEGFIRDAATCYITYVDSKRLSYSKLSPNFIALGFRRQIKESGMSNSPLLHVKLVDLFISGLGSRANLSMKNAINTYSNLNFEIFEEILSIVGLDRTVYESQKVLIDERLLKNRNEIAHGRYLEIDEDQYRELYTRIIDIINLFRDELENSAALKAYMR